MTRLEVKELSVDFGSRRVVDRASFCIAAGERLALVGESGSGKTVTALSLLRLVEAARLEGEITFEGRSVLQMTAPELQQLLGAMQGNAEAMDAFARVNAGVTSPAEFFSEENVGRIFAAAH